MREKKTLIENKTLQDIVMRIRLGVSYAEAHRLYTAQGEEYQLSLPVFMRLIKEA